MVCIYWLNISTHKKREPFASILVCSGLDSHLFQYMQKAHVKTRAICIILGKRYPNCREMNKSSNKANAYFTMWRNALRLSFCFTSVSDDILF